jgi:N-acetylglutamate synthase-like GNAT family acetyltransferase
MPDSRYIEKYLLKSDLDDLQAFYAEERGSKASVSYVLDRSPDFLEALAFEGTDNTILALYDTQEQRIAATLIGSTKPARMNGQPVTLGYVSSLRVGYDYRHTLVAVRLFRFFKTHCQKSDARIWLFSVFGYNTEGMAFFTKGSANVPVFQQINQSVTYIFKPRRRKTTSRRIIRKATPDDIPQLLAFIHETTQNQAFVPEYTAEQLLHGTGLLQDFNLNNLYLAFNNDTLCGTMALWDQSRVRRWKASNYAKPLRLLRQPLNRLLALLGYPELPAPGQPMPYRYLSLVFIQNQDPQLFHQLLNRIITDLRDKNQVLLFSLAKDNPMNAAMHYRSIRFQNNLFVGYWQEDRADFDRYDYAKPYLETGAL